MTSNYKKIDLNAGLKSGDYSGSIPLWQQLQAVAVALAEVRSGASATTAIEAVPAELRPGVQSLLFHVLRWLGQAEALRRKLAPRNPPVLADALLCTALALGWREQDAPYETFTLVDQAVEAAKRLPAIRPQSSFINACLRRFLRERGPWWRPQPANPWRNGTTHAGGSTACARTTPATGKRSCAPMPLRRPWPCASTSVTPP